MVFNDLLSGMILYVEMGQNIEWDKSSMGI